MTEIERLIDSLRLVSLDHRRSANELDELIRDLGKVKNKAEYEALKSKILDIAEARKQSKKLHGLTDLDKRERKLWKQLERIAKTETN